MRGDFKIIEQITETINYSIDELRTINSLITSNLESKDIWAGNSKNIGVKKTTITKLKNKIKSELDTIQNGFCPYCGFKFSFRLGERSKRLIHREHIAPKDQWKSFIFTEENLVLACVICNSLDYKSNTDTITSYDANYSNCSFSIIHPYYDQRSLHLQLDQQTGIYQIIDDSSKGKCTRDMFGLNEPNQVETRYLHLLFETYDCDNLEQLVINLTKQNHKI